MALKHLKTPFVGWVITYLPLTILPLPTGMLLALARTGPAASSSASAGRAHRKTAPAAPAAAPPRVISARRVSMIASFNYPHDEKWLVVQGKSRDKSTFFGEQRAA